jgi:PEGA domain
MLNLKSLITPSAMLAAFSLIAVPTFADQRDQGRRDGSAQQSTGRAVERGQSRGSDSRTADRSQPRAAEGRTVERSTPRAEAVAPPVVAPRSERVSPQIQGRRDAAVPRTIPRNDVVVPRGAYAPRYAPRYEPRYGYGIRGYYRPYVYRPRISIGFGIFAGYPEPYAYSYPYPVPVYGYAAPRGPVMITPGSNAYGGVALEITPNDAAVYVDGTYAGLVRDFDGSTQPLTLTGGTHRIDIEAQGFAPLSFDVGVQPGQVIPYRGDLQLQ